jgi:hypothetical protein
MLAKAQKEFEQHMAEKMKDLSPEMQASLRDMFCRDWEKLKQAIDFIDTDAKVWVKFLVSIFEMVGDSIHKNICPLAQAEPAD